MVRTRKAIYVGNKEVQRRYIGSKLIFILGRNLIISSDVTPDFYITSSGTHAAKEGHFITGFIEVKANEFYTISMLLQRNGYSRLAYYDLDKNFIKRDLFQYQAVTQIKPEQDGFIRWSPDVDSNTGGYGYG